MCQIFCCSIIPVSFNYHQRNVRSRVSVSNFQVSVSAFMTKSRSRFKIWARSRSRRLRSRLHHWLFYFTLWYLSATSWRLGRKKFAHSSLNRSVMQNRVSTLESCAGWFFLHATAEIWEILPSENHQNLMQHVSSLVANYSVVHAIPKPGDALKNHCKVKMWNLLVNLARFFLAKNTDEEVLHWRNSLNFPFSYSRLDHPYKNTRSLAAVVAIIQNVFRASTESWKLQSTISPPLDDVAKPFYPKLYVTLNFLVISLSYALGQHEKVQKWENILFSDVASQEDTSKW